MDMRQAPLSAPSNSSATRAGSQENVEVMRRMFEEWYAGVERDDPGAVFDTEMVADDFEFTLEGFEFDGRSVWRGREGYVEWFRTWTGEFEDWSLQPMRLIDAGHDRVVAITHQSASGRTSGAPVELDLGTIWELKDERIVRARTYRTPAEAFEAAGLSERATSQAIPPWETIWAGFDAFNRGDDDAWVAVYDQDVEFLDLAETPDTGTFRGHAGVRAWLAKLREAWGEGFRFEPRSITQGDDVVLIDTRASGVGAGSGVPIEMTVYVVMRYRDQKIVWTRAFTARADALEAAGLQE
jgi:ketosteroid isomerase-like protein